MSLIAAILFTILVYRHASGQARYNRALVYIMCVLSFITCIPAAMIGWHNNPRRATGESWRTAI